MRKSYWSLVILLLGVVVWLVSSSLGRDDSESPLITPISPPESPIETPVVSTASPTPVTILPTATPTSILDDPMPTVVVPIPTLPPPTAEPSPTPTPTPELDYVVVPIFRGDTLNRISLRCYHAESLWGPIVDRTNELAGQDNFVEINNPDLIFAGKDLAVPKLPPGLGRNHGCFGVQ